MQSQPLISRASGSACRERPELEHIRVPLLLRAADPEVVVALDCESFGVATSRFPVDNREPTSHRRRRKLGYSLGDRNIAGQPDEQLLLNLLSRRPRPIVALFAGADFRDRQGVRSPSQPRIAAGTTSAAMFMNGGM